MDMDWTAAETKKPEASEISKSLRYLMDRDGMNVYQLAPKVGVPSTTIYSILHKRSMQADISVLAKLAAFFKEDIRIFLGVDQYEKPVHLSSEERLLLSMYRRLNTEGRKKIMDYAGDITSLEKFRN